MEEVIIINLRRIGHFESCIIVPDKSNHSYWNLEVKALGGQGSEISKLETQRGVIRVFKTLDTAFRVGQKLGFKNITICGKSDH